MSTFEKQSSPISIDFKYGYLVKYKDFNLLQQFDTTMIHVTLIGISVQFVELSIVIWISLLGGLINVIGGGGGRDGGGGISWGFRETCVEDIEADRCLMKTEETPICYSSIIQYSQ